MQKKGGIGPYIVFAKVMRLQSSYEVLMSDTGVKYIYNKYRQDYHCVYHIFCDKHSGIHEGYIGVSNLSLEGLRFRYINELINGPHRRVHTMMDRYGWDIRLLAWRMYKGDALKLEHALRPEDNLDGSNPYNWNTKKGGFNGRS